MFDFNFYIVILRKIFPVKRVIFISEKHTRQLELWPLFQLLFLAVFTILIGFFAFRYNKYKNYHNYAAILEENQQLKDDYQQLREEFVKHSRRADKINEYISTLKILPDEKANNSKTESSKISKNKQDLEVEKQRAKYLTNDEMVSVLNNKTYYAYNQIDKRKKYIAEAVKKIGLSNISYNKVIKTAKISSADKDVNILNANLSKNNQFVGGVDEAVNDVKVVKNIPFIKVSQNSINNDNYLKEIDKMISVEKTLNSIPFGKPFKGEHRITSGYGFREDPLGRDKRLRVHRGIDIVVADKQVITPADGAVVFVGKKQGYGNCIDIEHRKEGEKNSIISHYAHLEEMYVKEGQRVNGGDVIATQGNTGDSTGHHLHYEIRFNKMPINPIKFMNSSRI